MSTIRHHHTHISGIVVQLLLCILAFATIESQVANGNELIGCYEKDDTLLRVNRVHQITVRNCIDACLEEEKSYAALEPAICYCTNIKNDARIVENARCLACPINPDEICGGFDVVAIYGTGIKGEMMFTERGSCYVNLMLLF